MQHQAMGYDRSSATFSPDGHLLQVEYAEKTVKLGSSSIGMVTSDGVLILADKRINDKLMIPDSTAKVHEIDKHIAATAAGILSDARVLVQKAQLSAQQHRLMYDSPVNVEMVVREIADLKQNFTQYGGARPFGISMLLTGIDKDNSRNLFITDVTGNYFGFKATAIGENEDKIKDILRKEYKDSMNTEEGLRFALSIFKRVMGKNFDLARFEAAYVKVNNPKFTRLAGNELKKYSK